jgi:DNA-binding transcriptional regulator YiaG
METGEKIKSIRMALGLTQVDFARPGRGWELYL